jgi:hypothetical protein
MHATVEALTVQIQSGATAADESKLERLLVLCDQLNGGTDTLASVAAARPRVEGRRTTRSRVGARGRGDDTADAALGQGQGAGGARAGGIRESESYVHDH